MLVIHKYPMHFNRSTISLPEGAIVITATEDRLITYVWAVVDPAKNKTDRHFQVFMAGAAKIPASAKYVATIVADSGATVKHVFEIFP